MLGIKFSINFQISYRKLVSVVNKQSIKRVCFTVCLRNISKYITKHSNKAITHFFKNANFPFIYFVQLQLHNSVHFHCDFLHTHLPSQPLELLQLHFTSSVQALEATGRVIQTGDHFRLSVNLHPKSAGLGKFIWVMSLLAQIPDWYATRLQCCNRAS